MARFQSWGRALRYGAGLGMRKTNVAILFSVLANPLTAEPITIAALGDSLTQGYGLPVEQGFVPQLESWLRDQGHDVVILNAGVSGDTTRGGMSRVDWTLTPDVDAMIVTLGGNDLLRGLPPEESRKNLDGILKAGRTQKVALMLVGMQAPGNFGPEYKREFDAMYPELAAKHDALLVDSFFAALETKPDQAAARSKYMQADGIHPSAAGVTEIVGTIGPEVVKLIKRVSGGA